MGTALACALGPGRRRAGIAPRAHAVGQSAFFPRNHRNEAAIRDAEVGRYDAFHELNNVLARPFEDQPQSARYAQPPAPHEEVLQTFCGT